MFRSPRTSETQTGALKPTHALKPWSLTPKKPPFHETGTSPKMRQREPSSSWRCTLVPWTFALEGLKLEELKGCKLVGGISAQIKL